jgi:hypothetical protein
MPPAQLSISIGSYASGYVASSDIICMCVGDGDVLNWDFKRNLPDAAWRKELVHEMLHEHQHKVVKAPSEEGKALCRRQVFALLRRSVDSAFA